MKRELANKMYSPNAYLFGRYTSFMTFLVFSPIIFILIIFWTLDIETTAENFGWYVAYGLAANFYFAGQGYLLGILIPDENMVKVADLVP